MSEKNIEKWFSLLGGETKEKCAALLRLIEDKRKGGEEIYPAQENILNAVSSVAPEAVRCVIIGQDPYHEPGQAMGLSFSVPKGEKLPPSLRNIFRELSADLGCAVPESGDLSSWARGGVLLLNTVLTVSAHKANSHKKLGWQSVTSQILRVTLKLPQPVVYLCWGKQAENTLDEIIGSENIKKPYLVLRSTHPSPLSANNHKTNVPAFLGSRPFGKTNAFLKENGAQEIQWCAGGRSCPPLESVYVR